MKAFYDLLDSLKNEQSSLSFFTQDKEFRSFIGRIQETINCFWDLLTFSVVFSKNSWFVIHSLIWTWNMKSKIYSVCYNTYIWQDKNSMLPCVFTRKSKTTRSRDRAPKSKPEVVPFFRHFIMGILIGQKSRHSAQCSVSSVDQINVRVTRRIVFATT